MNIYPHFSLINLIHFPGEYPEPHHEVNEENGSQCHEQLKYGHPRNEEHFCPSENTWKYKSVVKTAIKRKKTVIE